MRSRSPAAAIEDVAADLDRTTEEMMRCASRGAFAMPYDVATQVMDDLAGYAVDLRAHRCLAGHPTTPLARLAAALVRLDERLDPVVDRLDALADRHIDRALDAGLDRVLDAAEAAYARTAAAVVYWKAHARAHA